MSILALDASHANFFWSTNSFCLELLLSNITSTTSPCHPTTHPQNPETHSQNPPPNHTLKQTRDSPSIHPHPQKPPSNKIPSTIPEPYLASHTHRLLSPHAINYYRTSQAQSVI
ncbi:hypothetical protein BDW02DRAFT_564648 [Decorospora gaudefroyi]|uniref:Uncharacterized protein n=1 Tax=Decorospora gaudefroyi TaxID=184978 RepID=A0A6A5KTQ0_9PLEO|nr:hypothetical protein BDW02DRAFT_564648 [Decorospora gaudefroyi]